MLMRDSTTVRKVDYAVHSRDRTATAEAGWLARKADYAARKADSVERKANYVACTTTEKEELCNETREKLSRG